MYAIGVILSVWVKETNLLVLVHHSVPVDQCYQALLGLQGNQAVQGFLMDPVALGTHDLQFLLVDQAVLVDLVVLLDQ